MFFIYLRKCKTLRAIIIIKWRTFIFRIKESLFGPFCKIGASTKIVQQLYVVGRGKISIGEGSQLGIYPSPGFERGEFYLEARNETAEIRIGNNVYINNNCIMIADKSFIEIGDHTMIGPNFVCFDSNFHSLDPKQRMASNYKCKPVVIGENVFVGEGVKILRGVTVGCNSVLAAGLVLNFDVPPNVIVGVDRKIVKLNSTC
jgi:maltose O-acetyltransferase